MIMIDLLSQLIVVIMHVDVIAAHMPDQPSMYRFTKLRSLDIQQLKKNNL